MRNSPTRPRSTTPPGERGSARTACRNNVVTPLAAMSSMTFGLIGGALWLRWYAGPKSKPSTHVASFVYAWMSRGTDSVWCSRRATVAAAAPGVRSFDWFTHTTRPVTTTTIATMTTTRRERGMTSDRTGAICAAGVTGEGAGHRLFDPARHYLGQPCPW